MAELHDYALRIDGPKLRAQRQSMLDLLASKLTDARRALLEGLVNMLDEIADQAHDNYGIDCLLTPEVCDCELPCFFCSGVPGILAHLKKGRLAKGAKVQRCDGCKRYPTDEAALQKLKELGFVAP
jgi:hypothetical protein